MSDPSGSQAQAPSPGRRPACAHCRLAPVATSTKSISYCSCGPPTAGEPATTSVAGAPPGRKDAAPYCTNGGLGSDVRTVVPSGLVITTAVGTAAPSKHATVPSVPTSDTAHLPSSIGVGCAVLGSTSQLGAKPVWKRMY